MDNSVLPGTGDTYASDDIGGVKFPRVKLIYGSDGNNSGDVASDNPLPVAVPSGITISTPSGLRVSVPSLLNVGLATGVFDVRAPSGLIAIVPSLLNVGLATGIVGIQAPSGLALFGGTGALLSSTNPIHTRLPSGFFLGITASGLPVTDTNPLPVSSTPSPSGIAISGGTGAPVGFSNPLPVRVFTGLSLGALASGLPVTPQNPFQVALFGSGAKLDHTNPLAVSIPSGLNVNASATIGTGAQLGLVASGLPVTTSNPLPVNVVTGGDGSVQGLIAHGSVGSGAENPLGIGGFASTAAPGNVDDGDAVNGWFLPNGSQVTTLSAAGTLIAAGIGASSAGLRTAPASDGIWPISQGTGAQFLTTTRQATGTVQLVGQPTGQIFPVMAASPEVSGSNPTGGPFLQGFQGRSADPVAVASGAVVRAYADTLGKQIVMPGAPHSLLRSGFASVQGTGSTDLIAAPGSGFALVVTSYKAVNSSPTYASDVVLHDGTATLSGGFCAAGGGGFAEEGGMYPLFVATVNAPLRAVNLASGAAVQHRVTAYKAAIG